MKITPITAIACLTVTAIGCGSGNASAPNDMNAYAITANTYEKHYNEGFKGKGSGKWDAKLQYAWSRLGAAKTCNISFNQKSAAMKLKKTFGHDVFVHEINGISFHHLQSKSIPSFCTPQRLKEIKSVVATYR